MRAVRCARIGGRAGCVCVAGVWMVFDSPGCFSCRDSPGPVVFSDASWALVAVVVVDPVATSIINFLMARVRHVQRW